MLVLGALDMSKKTKKSWNVEFWAFKIMKSGFHYTKMEQKELIKLLKLVFKHIFTIKWQKVAIISLAMFLMIFLWFWSVTLDLHLKQTYRIALETIMPHWNWGCRNRSVTLDRDVKRMCHIDFETKMLLTWYGLRRRPLTIVNCPKASDSR